MKSFNDGMTHKHLCTAAAVLLAFCVWGNPRANAAKKAVKQQPISVIAHVAVPGTAAKQMLLQQQDGREYLYLLRSSGSGFTVLDVTKPEKPIIVKKVTLPQGSSTQRLDLLGSSMAIAEQTHTSTSASLDRPESIQLLDLQDPADPRSVQTFSGVTSLLAEDGRHLVYISNKDGLWILRRPTKLATHSCSSSDAISGYPECD
jgi:hypothetical protein